MDDETEYIVKSKDKEYKIKIYKLEDATSNIKISNILGIPTEWVNNHQYTCGVTSEMNNWIDKYRCIARNNYNEEESSCQIYN